MLSPFLVCFSHSEDYPNKGKYSVWLRQGVYKMEVWGAAGGTDGSSYSPGGYASGLISIYKDTQFYVQVGGKGTDGSWDGYHYGGYNGGGIGRAAPGGGGGTDIRAYEDSINHRIIVAGGGGGSNANYGWGGGYEGGFTVNDGRGNPGTQTHAGIGCTEYSANTPCFDGSFGYGGDGIHGTGTRNNCGAGGGGGWFGGASGGDAAFTTWGEGGGGSGFVLSSKSYMNAPSSYLLKYNTEVYLYEENLIGGNQDVPKRTGTGKEWNKNGDGHARITKITDFYTPTPVLCSIPNRTKKLETCEPTLKCTIHNQKSTESGPNMIYSLFFTTLE